MFQLFALQQYFQRQVIMPLFSKTHPAKQNKIKQSDPLSVISPSKMIKSRVRDCVIHFMSYWKICGRVPIKTWSSEGRKAGAK